MVVWSLQALARLEQEEDLIRKQTIQLGRLIIDFNAERGNIPSIHALYGAGFVGGGRVRGVRPAAEMVNSQCSNGSKTARGRAPKAVESRHARYMWRREGTLLDPTVGGAVPLSSKVLNF